MTLAQVQHVARELLTHDRQWFAVPVVQSIDQTLDELRAEMRRLGQWPALTVKTATNGICVRATMEAPEATLVPFNCLGYSMIREN